MEGVEQMTKRCLLSAIIILFALFFIFEAGAQTTSETPKEKEIVGNCQLGATVFLCFHDPKEPKLDKIKSEIGAVAANFKGVTEAVYVSGDDKKEDSLRETLNVLPGETAVFLVIPSGQVIARLKGADITKENLMKALLAPRKACCPTSSKKKCH